MVKIDATSFSNATNTSTNINLTSATFTFSTTTGTKEITDLTLSGTFVNDALIKWYAVVVAANPISDLNTFVAVKTAINTQNAFLLTLNTLLDGTTELKFFDSDGNVGTIDLDNFTSTTKFYIYVMRETYLSDLSTLLIQNR